MTAEDCGLEPKFAPYWREADYVAEFERAKGTGIFDGDNGPRYNGCLAASNAARARYYETPQGQAELALASNNSLTNFWGYGDPNQRFRQTHQDPAVANEWNPNGWVSVANPGFVGITDRTGAVYWVNEANADAIRAALVANDQDLFDKLIRADAAQNPSNVAVAVDPGTGKPYAPGIQPPPLKLGGGEPEGKTDMEGEGANPTNPGSGSQGQPSQSGQPKQGDNPQAASASATQGGNSPAGLPGWVLPVLLLALLGVLVLATKKAA